MNRRRIYQQGTALLTALFIMAIIAAASTALLWQQSIVIRQVTDILHTNDKQLAAGGMTLWATTSLEYQARHPHSGQLVDQLPMIYPKTTLNGLTIAGTVTDALAYININNVLDPFWYGVFLRLIVMRNPDVAEPEKLVNGVVAWISAMDMGGAQEDDKYIKAHYLPSHELMTDRSELRLILGVTPQLMENLAPYVIALPETTPINVNTASATVLMALVPRMTLATAQKIIARRTEQPFITTQDFIDDPDIQSLHFSNSEVITTISHYFLATAVITDQYDSLTLTSLLKRDSTHRVSILWQKQQ